MAAVPEFKIPERFIKQEEDLAKWINSEVINKILKLIQFITCNRHMWSLWDGLKCWEMP